MASSCRSTIFREFGDRHVWPLSTYSEKTLAGPKIPIINSRSVRGLDAALGNRSHVPHRWSCRQCRHTKTSVDNSPHTPSRPFFLSRLVYVPCGKWVGGLNDDRQNDVLFAVVEGHDAIGQVVWNQTADLQSRTTTELF